MDFATAILKGTDGIDTSSTGLILTNPGQLVWYCGGEQAMSLPTWNAIPKESAVNPPLRMTYRNFIPGNENWKEHIDYVFEEVLGKMTSKDSRIDIIGLAEGGLGAIQYLSENCKFPFLPLKLHLHDYTSTPRQRPPSHLLTVDV